MKRLRWLSVMAWILALGSPTESAGTTGVMADQETYRFRWVVIFHLERYPAMEIQDLYKLLFQAAMGSEHAVPDPAAARRWLERELSDLGATQPGPITVPLSPDGSLVRIDLRAFVANGGDPQRLLEAFVATADRFSGSSDRLERYWREIEALASEGEVPFERADLEAFFAGMRAAGFPAVRHTQRYRELYRPAYRVVLLELLDDDPSSRTSE